MTPLATIPPVYESAQVKLYLGDCLDLQLAASLERVDAVITDPPFSDRTHDGHDSVAHILNRDGVPRTKLGYGSWNSTHIESFCARFNPNGWLVAFTDDVLAPDWRTSMEANGRYVFQPIASLTPGRSVRLSGDGPSSWTDWLVVSRTKRQVKWGTLPGGYINRGSSEHMGGKPLGLMCRLVEDYSRPGDTVCDPTMGSGTTGIACLRTNRRFIGIERDPAHFATALERIKREEAQGRLL